MVVRLLRSLAFPAPFCGKRFLKMSAETPHAVGVSGTIDLRSSPGGAELTDKVHLLPCCIRQDGPCPVSHYFKPKETGIEVDGLKVKEAFFRGRRLHGATLNIPDGYSGFLLGKEDNQDKGMGEGDSDSNHWRSRAEFQNITYWNHDDVPSQDDPTLRCFHWFAIANADRQEGVWILKAKGVCSPWWGEDTRVTAAQKKGIGYLY